MTKGAGAKCNHLKLEVRTPVRACIPKSGRARCVRATQKTVATHTLPILPENLISSWLKIWSCFSVMSIRQCTSRYIPIEFILKSINYEKTLTVNSIQLQGSVTKYIDKKCTIN